MNILSKTIGEIVAENYRTADIFKKFNIDFCCKGNQSLSDVCLEKGVDSNNIVENIQAVLLEKTSTHLDYNSWTLDRLVDHIEKKHHRYVEEKIPILKIYLDKICKVHGEQHPELFKIFELFNQTAGALTTHMKKEEFILFPYIKKLVGTSLQSDLTTMPFNTIQNPIQAMLNEHDIEGERFREIAFLSHQYIPPADACNTYIFTYNTLKEFENDLHLHIHLENNILFPKAIDLENLLTKK